MTHHGNQCYGLADFLVLGTIKYWIRFVYIKKNERSFSALEVDSTQYFELTEVSSEILFA